MPIEKGLTVKITQQFHKDRLLAKIASPRWMTTDNILSILSLSPGWPLQGIGKITAGGFFPNFIRGVSPPLLPIILKRVLSLFWIVLKKQHSQSSDYQVPLGNVSFIGILVMVTFTLHRNRNHEG